MDIVQIRSILRLMTRDAQRSRVEAAYFPSVGGGWMILPMSAASAPFNATSQQVAPALQARINALLS